MAETPFQTLWQHSVVGLALVDNEGRFTDANPALCGYLEYTIAELQSRTFQSVTHPDDVAADVHMARSVAEKRAEGYDMVKRYITKRGSIVWANLRVVPILDRDGGFLGFLSQVAPMRPVEGPVKPFVETTKLSRIAAYWPQIAMALGAIGVIAAKIIEELRTWQK